MQINNLYLNDIIQVSLILGIILGALTPIPFVGFIFFVTMILLSAPVIMTFLIMDGRYQLTDIKNSIITGAITGFATNLSFAISYSLVTYIIGVTLKYKGNLLIYSMISNSPIWLLLTFIIFIGILVASINAFSGFGTYYVINLIRDMYEKKQKNLDYRNYKE